MAEEEYGEAEGWGITGNNQESAELIFEKLKPFIKIGTDCGLNDTKGNCAILTNYTKLNGKAAGVVYATNKIYYKIKLLNGTSVWWRGYTSSDAYLINFFVDTNGPALPNTAGKDLFTFYLYEGGQGLRPLNNSFNACTKAYNGWDCAYYILLNKNMNYLHWN